jgi:hypothetical protein
MSDGFKTGASADNPLATGDSTSDEADTDQEQKSNTQRAEPDSSAESGEGNGSAAETHSSVSLPWIYSRDSITDGRERTVQLHLRSSTIQTQTAVRSEVENQLDENIRLADLREAALLAGLTHTEAITDTLREWGYGID